MLDIIIDAMPKLLKGLLVTIQMTLGGLLLGFVIGIILAGIRIYGGKLLGIIADLYVRVLRSIPPIVLVFMLYLVINDIFDVSSITSVILALGLHSGAYQSEIFRSAYGTVSSGDIKAGLTLGMSNFQVFRHIIFPQLLINAIPGASNEITIVLKETSIGFVVGATELLRQANLIAAVSRDYLLMFSLVGLIYLIMTLSINKVLGFIESKFSKTRAI